jgi:hypothetical protein
MAAFPFDMVIMPSIMSYWYLGVQAAIDIVRRLVGNVPIILGGIYATLYNEHAARNSGTDFVYQGQLNQSLNFALYTFGFKLKKKGKSASTPL